MWRRLKRWAVDHIALLRPRNQLKLTPWPRKTGTLLSTMSTELTSSWYHLIDSFFKAFITQNIHATISDILNFWQEDNKDLKSLVLKRLYVIFFSYFLCFFRFSFLFFFLLLLFDWVCHFRDNYYIPPKLVLFRFNQLRGRTVVTAHLTLD